MANQAIESTTRQWQESWIEKTEEMNQLKGERHRHTMRRAMDAGVEIEQSTINIEFASEL